MRMTTASFRSPMVHARTAATSSTMTRKFLNWSTNFNHIGRGTASSRRFSPKRAKRPTNTTAQRPNTDTTTSTEETTTNDNTNQFLDSIPIQVKEQGVEQ